MLRTATKRFRLQLVTLSGLLLIIGSAIPANAAAQESQSSNQMEVSGRVLDAAFSEPIPFATIRIDGTTRGTAADVEGQFTLAVPHGTVRLLVSAVGFTAQTLEVDTHAPGATSLEIRLQPSVMKMDGVTVSRDAANSNDIAAPQRKLNATEDMLQRVAGVDLVQRANFAWEPTIRGMSSGQVGLVIDGMKVYGACVDKMDPASSYIEPENLERLEVTKGGFDLTQSSQIGGTVNLITQKPSYDRPYDLAIESGYESVAALRRLRASGGVSQGRFAARGSFSYRLADDFAPGDAEPIPHSGFEKRNYKASLTGRIADGHKLTASFLGDDAWNVGYPVLLMDATLAQARIWSLAYEGQPAAPRVHDISARIYTNHVDHWMDDRFRDVMEREVMRGMFMPMFGNTDTVGGLASGSMMFGRTHAGLTLDAHRVKQFGDMYMYSLFPNIPDMYLLNLGDVHALNTAATLDLGRPLTNRLNLRTNVRLDVSWRDIEREDMMSIFRSRYGIESTDRVYRLLSGSTVLEYALRPATRLRLSLASTARLPSNVENYGHYVYNYVDGYFYTGSPDLKPERSRQIEFGLDHTTTRIALRTNVFYNDLTNYIIGIADTGIGDALAGRTSTYRFRVYENTDSAYLTGAEFSGLLEVARGIEVAGSLSYTYGHNRTLGEPMPMIPPVKGFVNVRYESSRYWGVFESRWALAQNRVSVAADEDVTDGFNILSVRSGFYVTPRVEIKSGVENILDARYHEHLSIGNLPGRGRIVFVSAGFAL